MNVNFARESAYKDRDDATVSISFNNHTGKQVLCGWLVKLGNAGMWNADWKRRYFELEGDELSYYTDEAKTNKKGSISLRDATGVKPFSGGASGHTWPPSSTRFEVVCKNRTWVLSSGDSPSDKHIWLEAISAVISPEEALKSDSGADETNRPTSFVPPSVINDQLNKKEGWLATRKKVGGWKRRYVVLKSSKMQVYRDASFKVLKEQYSLVGGSVTVLFAQPQTSSGPPYALRLTLKSSNGAMSSSDWACDDIATGQSWKAVFDQGSKVTQEAETYHETHSTEVSCDLFEEHPIFGLKQCRSCGVSKKLHFDARNLLLAATDPSAQKQVGASDGGPNLSSVSIHFSLPFVNHMEGWLHVRKKHGKMSDLGIAGWKKRYVILHGLEVIITNSNPTSSLASSSSSSTSSSSATALSQQNSQSFPINSASRIVRRQVGGVNPTGNSSGDTDFGKWQFSLESGSDSNAFATVSQKDREAWLSALMVSIEHCHAVSSARLEAAKLKSQHAANQMQAASKLAESTTTPPSSSSQPGEAADTARPSDLSSLSPQHQKLVKETEAEFAKSDYEYKVLLSRFRERKHNVTIHEDEVKAGAVQYERLAAKIAKSSPEWLARFFDKGNCELLANKLHDLMQNISPTALAINPASLADEDVYRVMAALTECLYAAANTILGLHYLSSHKRDCLHILCRAAFMDASAPIRMPSLVNTPTASPTVSSSPKYNKNMKNEYEVVGGVLQPIKSQKDRPSNNENLQGFVPLLHLDITSKLLEILNSLATFSGDGRNAVIEALSCLSILKKEHLLTFDSGDDGDDSIGYGMIFGGEKNQEFSMNNTSTHSSSKESAGGSATGIKANLPDLSHASDDENDEYDENEDMAYVGEVGNLQTLLQRWDSFNSQDKAMDEYDMAAAELDCKWNLYAPFGMLIAVLDASTTSFQQSGLMAMQSKSPPPLYGTQGVSSESSVKFSNKVSVDCPLLLTPALISHFVNLFMNVIFPESISTPPLSQRLELAQSLKRVGLTDLLNRWKRVTKVEIELLQGKSLIDGIDKDYDNGVYSFAGTNTSATLRSSSTSASVASSPTTTGGKATSRLPSSVKVIQSDQVVVVKQGIEGTSQSFNDYGNKMKVRPQVVQRSATATANNSAFGFGTSSGNSSANPSEVTPSMTSAPLSTATRFLRTFTKGPSASNLNATATATTSNMTNATLPGFRRKTAALDISGSGHDSASSSSGGMGRSGTILDPAGRSGSVLSMPSSSDYAAASSVNFFMRLEDWEILLEGLEFLLDAIKDDEETEAIEVEDGNVKAVFDRCLRAVQDPDASFVSTLSVAPKATNEGLHDEKDIALAAAGGTYVAGLISAGINGGGGGSNSQHGSTQHGSLLAPHTSNAARFVSSRALSMDIASLLNSQWWSQSYAVSNKLKLNRDLVDVLEKCAGFYHEDNEKEYECEDDEDEDEDKYEGEESVRKSVSEQINSIDKAIINQLKKHKKKMKKHEVPLSYVVKNMSLDYGGDDNYIEEGDEEEDEEMGETGELGKAVRGGRRNKTVRSGGGGGGGGSKEVKTLTAKLKKVQDELDQIKNAQEARLAAVGQQFINDLQPSVEAASTQQQSKLLLKDDPMYAKYFKMLKMHLPKAAVAMKMQVEGMDASVLDMDPEGPSPNEGNAVSSGSSDEPKVLLKDDPMYAKYFKMLKMHLPKAAVAMKMQVEGMDASVLDMDPEGPSPNQPSSASSASSSSSVQDEVAKARAQKLKAEKEEANRKAQAEMTAKAAQEAKAKLSALARAVYMGPKPKVPTKAVYIDKVPDNFISGSLFGETYDVLQDSSKITPYTTAIENGFCSGPSKVIGKLAAKEKEEAGPLEVTSIDPRRAQNLSIAVKKLGVTKPEAVAGAILQADDEFLNEEKVDLLRRMKLEEDELDTLRSTARTLKPDQKLRSLESFLLVLYKVPRLDLKLGALAVRYSLVSILEGASKNIATWTDCLMEIHASRALVSLMRLCLHVSNFMNSGTSRMARAIQLKSIEKFTHVKGKVPESIDIPEEVVDSSKSKGNGLPSVGSNDVNKQALDKALTSPPPFVYKSLLHYVAYVATYASKADTSPNTTKLGADSLLLAQELPTLPKASLLDFSLLDTAISELTTNLTVAKKEVSRWCEDSAKSATTSTASSSAEATYALQSNVPLGVLELRAALARAEVSIANVKEERAACLRLGSDVLSWYGEAAAPPPSTSTNPTSPPTSPSSMHATIVSTPLPSLPPRPTNLPPAPNVPRPRKSITVTATVMKTPPKPPLPPPPPSAFSSKPPSQQQRQRPVSSSMVQASGSALQEFILTLNTIVKAYQSCLADNREGEYLEKKRQQRLISEQAAQIRKRMHMLDQRSSSSGGDSRPASVGRVSTGRRVSKTRIGVRSVARTGGRPHQQLRVRRGSTLNVGGGAGSSGGVGSFGGNRLSNNIRSSFTSRRDGRTPSASMTSPRDNGVGLFGALSKMRTNIAGTNKSSTGDDDSSSDDGMWGSDDD